MTSSSKGADMWHGMESLTWWYHSSQDQDSWGHVVMVTCAPGYHYHLHLGCGNWKFNWSHQLDHNYPTITILSSSLPHPRKDTKDTEVSGFLWGWLNSGIIILILIMVLVVLVHGKQDMKVITFSTLISNRLTWFRRCLCFLINYRSEDGCFVNLASKIRLKLCYHW